MSTAHAMHHILLVDDDTEILEAFGTLLELNGVEVVRAPSAFAALRTLQVGELPCLVLLDIRMPGMTGWDLWNWMRRDPTTAGIPVVMITGETQDRDAARAQGVVEVLQKPVDVDRVLQLVAEACQSSN